jgi:hypothetical protein
MNDPPSAQSPEPTTLPIVPIALLKVNHSGVQLQGARDGKIRPLS